MYQASTFPWVSQCSESFYLILFRGYVERKCSVLFYPRSIPENQGGCDISEKDKQMQRHWDGENSFWIHTKCTHFIRGFPEAGNRQCFLIFFSIWKSIYVIIANNIKKSAMAADDRALNIQIVLITMALSLKNWSFRLHEHDKMHAKRLAITHFNQARKKNKLTNKQTLNRDKTKQQTKQIQKFKWLNVAISGAKFWLIG